jgi:DNA-binding NarL/FixJ family response regulator
MSPAVARLVLEQLHAAEERLTARLTERQRDVLEQLASGLRYDQMALTLEVTTNTVRAHVRSIYRKLDAATRIEAVLTGVKLGEIDRSWQFAEA